MPDKYSESRRQGKKKISPNQQDLIIFFAVVCDKTIIPLAFVGYKCKGLQ